MAREVSGVQQITASISSARSASSIVVGSRPARKPTTSSFLPDRVEVVEQHAAQLSAPGRVVRAVDDDERLVPQHLEAARACFTAAKASSTTSWASGASKKASAAASATEAFSPWYRPWSGRYRSL